MMIFVVHLTVPPENRDALEALLGQVRDATLLNEPGVAWYGFGRSVDRADTYVVVEAYRDAEVHAAHMATAWVRESIPEARRLTGGAIEIRQYAGGDAAAIRKDIEWTD